MSAPFSNCARPTLVSSRFLTEIHVMYAEMLATLAPGTAAQTAQSDSTSDTFDDATNPPQVAISTSTPPIHPIQSPPTQATTSHPVNTIAETSSLTASPQLAAKFSALAHPQNPTGEAVPQKTPVEDVETLPHESDEKSETSDESTDSDEKSETSDDNTDSDDSDEALTQSIEQKALAPTEDGTSDSETPSSELSKNSESTDNSSDSDSENFTGDNTDTDSESEKSGEDLETVTPTILPTTSSPTVTPVLTETFTPLSTLSPNTLPMTATTSKSTGRGFKISNIKANNHRVSRQRIFTKESSCSYGYLSCN